MKQASSDYPAGRAGIGLASLRGALIADLLGISLQISQPPVAALWSMAVLALMIAMGLLTRFAVVLTVVFSGLALVNAMGCAPLLIAGTVLAATALALLGAGAYSVDARLFGRRIITIAPRTLSSRQGDMELP